MGKQVQLHKQAVEQFDHGIGINSIGHSAVQHGALSLCSLLAANSQITTARIATEF